MAEGRESPSGGREIKAPQGRGKGDGNCKCGGLRGRDGAIDRDRGSHK